MSKEISAKNRCDKLTPQAWTRHGSRMMSLPWAALGRFLLPLPRGADWRRAMASLAARRCWDVAGDAVVGPRQEQCLPIEHPPAGLPTLVARRDRSALRSSRIAVWMATPRRAPWDTRPRSSSSLGCPPDAARAAREGEHSRLGRPSPINGIDLALADFEQTMTRHPPYGCRSVALLASVFWAAESVATTCLGYRQRPSGLDPEPSVPSWPSTRIWSAHAEPAIEPRGARLNSTPALCNEHEHHYQQACRWTSTVGLRGARPRRDGQRAELLMTDQRAQSANKRAPRSD